MSPFIQVMKHADGSVSYWFAELSDEDERRLYDAIEPIANIGFGCRGEREIVMDELNKLLEEVPGWA